MADVSKWTSSQMDTYLAEKGMGWWLTTFIPKGIWIKSEGNRESWREYKTGYDYINWHPTSSHEQVWMVLGQFTKEWTIIYKRASGKRSVYPPPMQSLIKTYHCRAVWDGITSKKSKETNSDASEARSLAELAALLIMEAGTSDVRDIMSPYNPLSRG